MRWIAAMAIGFASSAASADIKPDAWDGHDLGPKRAAMVISECLARAGSTPDLEAESCPNAAFRTCEMEHGTRQRDLTACAYFLRSAWEARLADVRSRLLSVRTHPMVGEDPEPRKRMLRASDEMWDRWNKADCEMQLVGQGGTMLPMLEHLCFGDHAAQRTLELEDLVFWWEKAFEFPE